MKVSSLATALLATYLVIPNVQAASVSYFPPSIYDTDTTAMDATLGITGYLIEDFEDTSLISGLTITQSFRDGSPDVVFTGTLPSVQPKFAPNTNWDGENVLTNTLGNSDPFDSPRSEIITFSFAPTSSVGIGLAGFQSVGSPDSPFTDHIFFINGSQIGTTLENLIPTFQGERDKRNGYLRIDADAGELISSIAFQNIKLTGSGAEDFLEFDRFAIQSSVVPIPAAIWLFGTALVGLLGFTSRRRTVNSSQSV